MSIYSKTAAGWVEVAGGGSKAALSSWGRVVGEPEGAVTSTYFASDDGSQWQYWEFNTEGTYEIDLGNGGLFWVLAVGGGSQSYQQSDYLDQGTVGDVTEGLWEFGPGTHTVTVGKKGEVNGGTGTAQYGQPSFIDDRITGYGTQAVGSWGNARAGRGSGFEGSWDDNVGYKSRITGDLLEYATGRETSPPRPGQGGRNGYGTATDGCVIIATRIDVEQLAPAPAELAPAPVLGAPVKVSGTADVVEYIVRQKDGTRKKIYMLPGATGDNSGESHPENVFEVTLGAGVLPGVMVGAGGCGGFGESNMLGGGGGAGGVIGQGANVPVILPVQGTATYTVTVGSTSVANGTSTGHQGQATTLAVQGQTPFMAAVGGGTGGCGSSSNRRGSRPGGSGGGGSDNTHYVGFPGPGVPGQGNTGNYRTDGNHSGGGGGYGSGNENTNNGGAGFDLATALNLDANDGLTGTFLDLVSVDGWIAGGGAGNTGTATAGGGLMSGHGKDHSGGGGGGASNATNKNGGCGVVYIITDA